MNKQEDWLRNLAWDVTNPDGTPVVSLAALARVLGCTPARAVRRLLDEPFGEPAPAELLAQARAAHAHSRDR